MTRLLRTVVSLFAFTLGCTAQQAPAAATAGATSAPASASTQAPRKPGHVYREEIDQIVDAICRRATAKGADAPLGGDSVLATAQILTAMGHCHRFYHRSDGPVVRPSLQSLLRARAADGTFGTGDDAVRATATAWVVDALTVMDADGYADEIATARAWLQKHSAPDSLWAQAVSTVLGEVRADVFPQHLAKEQAEFARAARRDPSAQPIEALAVAAVRLVACQEANRRLDGAQGLAPTAGAFTASQQKAFDWLAAQLKDGIYTMVRDGKGTEDPAITAFAMLALQTKPKAARTQQEQQAIERGLRWLLSKQNDDGSFGEQLLNYTTSVCVGALVRWDDAAVKPALAKAQQFILKCQFLEANGYQSSDRDYGAMGYGGASNRRADLSNTNFALQALRDTGLPANHEAFAKALTFLQRTQNLKTVNDFTGKVPDPEKQGAIIHSTSGDDGGACYYPGNSSAGYIVLPDGKSTPRSYGSMTYALLKAYSLCGLKADDARVRAAVQWMQTNWTLTENPGVDPALGDKARYQGLYYYYMVMAQALDTAGVDELQAASADGKTQPIAWRKALRAQLEAAQLPNGTWLNAKNERWMEGRDVLCTCYAMVALEHCK